MVLSLRFFLGSKNITIQAAQNHIFDDGTFHLVVSLFSFTDMINVSAFVYLIYTFIP